MDLAGTDPARARRLAQSASAQAGASAEVDSVTQRALGLVALSDGRLDAATTHLREAIGRAEAGGLPVRAAEARVSLAFVLADSGATADALRHLDAAGEVLEGVAAAQVAMQRALILTGLGHLDEAVSGHEEALAIIARAGGHLSWEARVRTNRGMLLAYRGEWRAAENDLRHAEALYAAAGRGHETSIVHHNLGFLASLRGDVPAALAWYDQAEAEYRASGRHPGLLPIDRTLALLSVRLAAEARSTAEAAIAEYARRGMASNLAEARCAVARAALLDGDPTTARVEAERARRAFVRQQRPAWAALARYLALRADWEQGHCTEAALRKGRRTVAALAETGWVAETLDARLVVARIALQLGRPATARAQLRAAARSRSHATADLRARASYAEALLRLSRGDRRGAGVALRAGLGVLDRFRESLGATELRAHVSESGAELAGLGLRLAIERGRPEAVLSWAERWRAGSLRARPARPPDDVALADDLAALRRTVTELHEATLEGRDPEPLLRRQARLEDAVRRRARHAPGAPVQPRAVRIPSLRERLGEDALVEFVESAGGLHAVVVTERRVRLHWVGRAEEVGGQLDALRFALRRLARAGSQRSLAAAAESAGRSARQLDALLFGAVRADTGDRNLVVVPTGRLHALPWVALPSCRGRSVCVAPSAALWHRATGASATEEGAVLVAGPDLAHADAEIDALAGRYGDALRLQGSDAGVDKVAAAIDGAATAHLATHGRFRADNPLFSELSLADGPLTVYDLERLERPPTLLVLSACESGLSDVRPGDELMGLAAAVLGLGTRTLVASVVPVPDDATRTLMLAFHDRVHAGARPGAALAWAQEQVRGDGPAGFAVACGFVCLGAG